MFIRPLKIPMIRKMWAKRCLLGFLAASFVCLPAFVQDRPDSGQSGHSDLPFPSVEPGSLGIDQKKLNRITDQIETWINKEEIVGAVVHMIKSRKTVLHQAAGWRDQDTKLPMETNTICRLRSMTKPIVGTAVLMLKEEGKIALSDRVSRFVPAYRNEKCRSITVEQLLKHTGGFEQPGYPSGPQSYDDLADLIDTVGKIGPTYGPGERYSYSDAGSSTLAHLVSVVSGMPAEAFIQSRILDPLMMSSTFCNLTEQDPRRDRVSCTYSGGKRNWRAYWKNDQPQAVPYFRGSGGIYSTTEDYARFLATWMDRGMSGSGHFLESVTAELALTVSPQSEQEDRGYGLHWEIFSIESGIFGHRGSDGTMAIALPDEDLMFLYFTQSRGNQTLSRMRDLFFKLFRDETD